MLHAQLHAAIFGARALLVYVNPASVILVFNFLFNNFYYFKHDKGRDAGGRHSLLLL